MNVYLEIFGYIGMVLVLVSMMMTSLKWLRVLNMTGALVCAVYGILTNTWPTAMLNIGILLIQIMQLCRMHFQEKKGA